MKTLMIEILFCILFLAILLGMIAIAEFLSKVISINTVMTTVYVVGVLSFIYLIKN